MDGWHERRTANDRLKERFQSTLALSLIGAAMGHLLVFQMFPELTAAELSSPDETLIQIQQLEEVPLPPPPKQLGSPVPPVLGSPIDADATIATFDWDRAVDPPPPPPPAPGEGVSTGSGGFEVWTVAPRLLDPDELQDALERAYPRMLRDARIGGAVTLVLDLDADGVVQAARVGTSSGHVALDEAALSLAKEMSFSPAMNRDRYVAVQISIPVEFRVRR